MAVIRRKKEESNGNLVLHLKKGETLLVDGNIKILIYEIPTKNRVKLVINAPQTVKVRRKLFEETRNKVKGQDSSET